MTPEEARGLVGDKQTHRLVRPATGFSTVGRVIAYVDEPAMLVQTPSGNRILVVANGAEVDDEPRAA